MHLPTCTHRAVSWLFISGRSGASARIACHEWAGGSAVGEGAEGERAGGERAGGERAGRERAGGQRAEEGRAGEDAGGRGCREGGYEGG
jgi:hypothetical protein